MYNVPHWVTYSESRKGRKTEREKKKDWRRERRVSDTGSETGRN
jgi:hypothetical protein